MNGQDQFERRLQRLAPAKLPPSWRDEILEAARATAASPRPSATAPRLPASLGSRLAAWLWPHPTAWAGLAALWLLIAGLNLATREPSRLAVSRPARPPSPEMRELLKQQEQMFAELVGPMEKPEADRPRPAAPQPRSQRRPDFINA
jgi:hypothetical protein